MACTRTIMEACLEMTCELEIISSSLCSLVPLGLLCLSVFLNFLFFGHSRPHTCVYFGCIKLYVSATNQYVL